MRRVAIPPPLSFTLPDARGLDVGTRETFLTFAQKTFLGAPWWMLPGKPHGAGPGLGPFRAMRKVGELEQAIEAMMLEDGQAKGPWLVSEEDWRLCCQALEEPGEMYNPKWFRPCLPFAAALVEAERVASPVVSLQGRRVAEESRGP